MQLSTRKFFKIIFCNLNHLDLVTVNIFAYFLFSLFVLVFSLCDEIKTAYIYIYT